MMQTPVHTYTDGELVSTEWIDVPELAPEPVLVTVDPQALSEAQAAVAAASTVAALRKATLVALDLLNPST